MRKLRARHCQSGMTLTEMTVSIVILLIASAGISGLIMLSNLTTMRIFNKVDGINAARSVIDSIGMHVRQAVTVGDQYGSGSDGAQFPAAGGANPYHPAGVTPTPVGWPGAPWALDHKTLVLQLPVTYLNPVDDPHDPSYNTAPHTPDPNNGFVQSDRTGRGTPNVDTVIYKMLPDAARPGEFLLQRVLYNADLTTEPPPGPTRARTTYLDGNNNAQTVLRGIVGPIPPASTEPQIFRYINRANETVDSVTDPTDIRGVIVQFELLREGEGTLAPSKVGIKGELYLRNSSSGIQ